jgi:integrase
MASVRKRTWQSKGGERSAWVVAYAVNGKQHLKTFATKREAVDWRAEMQREVRLGTHTPTSKSPTVRDAGKAWLHQAGIEGLEPSTVAQYRQHLDLHITPFIGDVRLADLTPATVRDFRNTLSADRSQAMVIRVATSLGAIVEQARNSGLVGRNAVREFIRQTATRRRRLESRHSSDIEIGADIPTVAEVRALLDVAGRWRPFLMTAVFTGLRASELRGLPWRNVDLRNAVIRVTQRADRYAEIGAPKAKASRRQVPMSSAVVAGLRELKIAATGDLVFPNQSGGILDLGNVHRALGTLQVRLGWCDSKYRPKYGLHSLRHFAASLFIEQGLSPKRVQALMGHSNIAVTFDTYGHLFPSQDDDRAAFEKMQAQVIAQAHESTSYPEPRAPSGP